MYLATIKDALKILNAEKRVISETALRNAVKAGKLPSLPLGNRLLVDVDAARQMIAPPNTVGIAEVMSETGLTGIAVRRGVREGWLPGQFTGYRYVFDLDAVKKAIKKRMEQHMKTLK